MFHHMFPSNVPTFIKLDKTRRDKNFGVFTTAKFDNSRSAGNPNFPEESFNDFSGGRKFLTKYEKSSKLFRPIQIAWRIINDRQYFRNRKILEGKVCGCIDHLDRYLSKYMRSNFFLLPRKSTIEGNDQFPNAEKYSRIV